MRLHPTTDASLIATLNRSIHEHHTQFVPAFLQVMITHQSKKRSRR